MSKRDWSEADLIDVPERRAVAQAFEVRAAGNNIAKITGYASVFNRGYDVHGGPDAGGFTEVVTPGAFKRTLADNPHVHLLINHEGLPLASTKSGTLRLSTDSMGLISEAEVDRRNSRANDAVLTLERGDADEMSFAFRVKGQSWSDDETIRSLEEVSLHKGDVSVVSFGANPFTSVSVRNAVRMLAREDLSPREMAEIRAMSEQVDRAMSALKTARADKPYGDVAYADPKDGKYPIDTKEHVKAAWSYINMPKNQKGYSPAELAEIKGRIRAAAKKFGIEISDDESNSRALAPNIIVGDKSAFAQQVHDLALNAGANCDPTDIDAGTDGGALAPLRAMSPLADYSEDLNGGDVFDEGEPRDSTLAQAIHDLCAVGGAECDGDEPVDDTPMYEPVPESNSAAPLSLADASKLSVNAACLTRAEALRLCRPDDSPDPLSLADATRLAS